jgi:hypothetical protein
MIRKAGIRRAGTYQYPWPLFTHSPRLRRLKGVLDLNSKDQNFSIVVGGKVPKIRRNYSIQFLVPRHHINKETEDLCIIQHRPECMYLKAARTVAFDQGHSSTLQFYLKINNNRRLFNSSAASWRGREHS